MPAAEKKIEALVARATGKYEFRRRYRDHTLVRGSQGGGIERLVAGRWIHSHRPLRFDDTSVWQKMDERLLSFHVRRYLLEDLDAPGMGWRGGVLQRARRGAIWRWVLTPPKGGASIGPRSFEVLERTRNAIEEDIQGSRGDDLAEMKDEALRGLEYHQNQSALVEQRGSFFLGAAGVSTSLVLVNAGLLIGTGKLEAPLLQFAAGALGLASVCAAIAGFRAIQATMLSFVQVVPHAALKRRGMTGDSLIRSYIAQVIAAEQREKAISEWKRGRLTSARRWFFGTLAGVTLLTVIVLIEAL